MTDIGPYLTISTVISSFLSTQTAVTSCFDMMNFAYPEFCCNLGSVGKDNWLTGNSNSFFGEVLFSRCF